jgi:diaminopimelate epimerase
VSELSFYSAAGNRFAVLEAFELMPADPAALARELCARHGVDGLLLGAPPLAGGDCRMLVYNRDGSRAEACGNGLRALARWAVESEHAGDSLVIETDAGPRRVACLRHGREIVGARAELGVPRVVEREAVLEIEGGTLRATLVDMGNPHCVVFVRELGRAEVARIGSAVECHTRFPQRTNVSFVEASGGRLLVRTWERGVGETAACGTGAGASAVAALEHGLARSPVEVGTRGGRLRVDWNGGGSVLTLAGPVEALRG